MSAVRALEPVEECETDKPVLRQLVEQQLEQGHTTSKDIAQALLEEYGLQLFAELGETEVFHFVAQAVKSVLNRTRSHSFYVTRQGGGGGTEATLRMHLRQGAYWSANWQVGELGKQTRELTPPDLDWLIRDRTLRTRNLLFQIKWLNLVRDLASKHHVKTLHDLERKGIELPELEEPEEDE